MNYETDLKVKRIIDIKVPTQLLPIIEFKKG